MTAVSTASMVMIVSRMRHPLHQLHYTLKWRRRPDGIDP
jgi:hypothetical protein